MFIPICLALLCITNNLHCGDSLIHYPYAEEGLVCSALHTDYLELRADCIDYTKSFVRDIQRSHTVIDIINCACSASCCISTAGVATQECGSYFGVPNLICEEKCCKLMAAASYACCFLAEFQLCLDKCLPKHERDTFRLNRALKAWSESRTDRPLPLIFDSIEIKD